MIINELQADIDSLLKNAAIWQERNFNSRVDALDFLDFHVIDRLAGLCQLPDPPAGLLFLRNQAQQLKRQLEAVDQVLFQRLRETMRQGHCSGAALLNLLNTYVDCYPVSRPMHEIVDYDNLDLFTNRLFDNHTLPEETVNREPQMVHYQKTPARVILELNDRARFTQKDVFYDLGSGLGQVTMLIHLLSGVPAIGVDIEPAYCAYANACATSLNLVNVSFITADARIADFSNGTVFFLYTPFSGLLLQDVLDRLREQSKRTQIRLFTYGPCTLHVGRQSWLEHIGQANYTNYQLAEFHSIRNPAD